MTTHGVFGDAKCLSYIGTRAPFAEKHHDLNLSRCQSIALPNCLATLLKRGLPIGGWATQSAKELRGTRVATDKNKDKQGDHDIHEDRVYG